LRALTQKFKEAFLSVFPIAAIVLFLNFTVSPLEPLRLYRFLIGALFIVAGLSLFLFGVELGIDPIGQHMGSAIAKTNKTGFVIFSVLLLGFFVSVAEPDLHILAGQVDAVSSGVISKLSIVAIVSIGIAAMLALGFFRILYNIPLNLSLLGLYLVIFALSFFTSSEFMAISFDASGATTGALTVPFVLALAMGVSALKKDSRASEKDSFGLVAITSTGAIIAVMVMSIVSKTDKITGSLETASETSLGLMSPFAEQLPKMALEILIALTPIVLLFFIFKFRSFVLSRGQLRRILFGVGYAFIGLVLFLTGVNAGFMEAGAIVGFKVAALNKPSLLVAIGFFLGLFTVLAEPAVHALTNQIEAVTSGYVKKRTVLVALTIGIGIAVALSMVRILVPGLQLWHYLLPGYLISLGLSFVVPKLCVGIAFDSGGVASGPMTATFILAFAQGAAEAIDGADVMLDGFGIIAMVALTPLITLQVLGLIYKLKSRKEGAENDDAVN